MTKKITLFIAIFIFAFLLGAARILLEYHQIYAIQLFPAVFFAFLFLAVMFFILRGGWAGSKREYIEAERKLNMCVMYRRAKIMYGIIISCIIFIGFLFLIKNPEKIKSIEISLPLGLLAVTGWYSYTIRQYAQGDSMKDELRDLINETVKRGIRSGIVSFLFLGIIISIIFFLVRHF